LSIYLSLKRSKEGRTRREKERKKEGKKENNANLHVFVTKEENRRHLTERHMEAPKQHVMALTNVFST